MSQRKLTGGEKKARVNANTVMPMCRCWFVCTGGRDGRGKGGLRRGFAPITRQQTIFFGLLAGAGAATLENVLPESAWGAGMAVAGLSSIVADYAWDKRCCASMCAC